jgi:hypothetical protein
MKEVEAKQLKWKQLFYWHDNLYQKVGYKKTRGLALLVRDISTGEVKKFPKGYKVLTA